MIEKPNSEEKCAIGPEGERAKDGQSFRHSRNQSRDASSEKAQSFFQKINARRRIPGHCIRCGHVLTAADVRTRDGLPAKRCNHCKIYHAQYKKKQLEKPLTIANLQPMLAAMTRRIGSLEIAVARLQLDGRTAYTRGWQKGYARGQRERAHNFEGICGEHAMHKIGCKTSLAELASISHVFARRPVGAT